MGINHAVVSLILRCRRRAFLIPYGVCVELLHARSAVVRLGRAVEPTSNRYWATCRGMSVVNVGLLRHQRPRERLGFLDDEGTR